MKNLLLWQLILNIEVKFIYNNFIERFKAQNFKPFYFYKKYLTMTKYVVIAWYNIFIKIKGGKFIGFGNCFEDIDEKIQQGDLYVFVLRGDKNDKNS